MRRTIVVVILAVAIAAFAVLQTVFMNNTERELDAILDELEACVSEENWTEADRYADEAFEFMEGKIEVLGWLVDHTGPDDIQLEIATLRAQVAIREKEEATAAVRRVRMMMEDVRRSDSPSLRNIF